jgi:hypothetical protein
MTANNYQNKITALWTTFLLGTLFHTDLGLMPLFHGQDVANSHEAGDVSWVFWLMLIFFVLPLFAMIATTFTNSRRYRILHFGLTILYTVLNFFHVVADLSVKPIVWYQIALMVILFVIGLLLNLVSFQWLKYHPKKRYLQESPVNL